MKRPIELLFPYALTTAGVTVRVSVSYLAEQSDTARGRWFWSYHIRVENGRSETVRLIARRWIITDGHGARHRVEGEGVVGAQPLIDPGAAYDYVSGCPLDTPSGAMEGSYRMIAADGSAFDARIPRFALTAPAVAR